MELYEFDALYDIDDDDEIDLVKLVTTNANDTTQYLIFMSSDGKYFAINVSKVEELVVFRDIELVKNGNETLVYATGDIRGEMTPLMRFDEWYGNPVLDDEGYELVIIVNYGGHRFGMIVKGVEYIVNIESDAMIDNSENNPKTSFITKVKIGRSDELCLIFDSDKMLLDLFENVERKSGEQIAKAERVASNKRLLFCDDSKFIRKMVEDLFDRLGLRSEIYVNGEELFRRLESLDKNEVGLIVTDLEMPKMGGRELINHINSHGGYEGIPIVVHTNMANDIAKESLLELPNVVDVIGKVDMLALSQSIEEHMLR